MNRSPFCFGFLVGLHHFFRRAHHREAAVVKQVLAGNHARIIGEHHHYKIGTLLGGGVAEGRHFFGKIVESVKTTNARARRGARGRLRNGVYAHFFQLAVAVAVAAGNGFEHGLGFGHVGIERKGALSGHVGQGQHRAVFVDNVHFFGYLQKSVERQSRHVHAFQKPIVVQIAVGAALANVGQHMSAAPALWEVCRRAQGGGSHRFLILTILISPNISSNCPCGEDSGCFFVFKLNRKSGFGCAVVFDNEHFFARRSHKSHVLQIPRQIAANSNRPRWHKLGGVGNDVVAHVSANARWPNGQCALALGAAAWRVRAKSRIVGQVPFQGIFAPISHRTNDYVL